MAAELHIKDSYYFEVPKFMWRYHYQSKADFPEVWVKNDPQFQKWEAERECSELEKLQSQFNFKLPPTTELLKEYEGWVEHDHANFGKPFHVYLEQGRAALHNDFEAQVQQANKAAEKAGEPKQHFKDWLALPEQQAKPFAWYAQASEDPAFRQKWSQAKSRAGNVSEFGHSDIVWSPEKIQAYNDNLSGKILLTFQPFGKLKNLYEPEPDSVFCISKFMVIEVAVALILLWVFSAVGRKISSGQAPKGKVWNLLEVLLLFVRDEIARKAISGHDHDEHADDHSHDAHVHAADSHVVTTSHGHDDHAHAASAHAVHAHPADKFVPLLWTMFFFILACNLMGMLPWVGAPTGSFRTTFALACVTFFAVLFYGSLKFGVLGFWKNQIPSMDLPLALAIILKPPIFLIEVLGLFIKHGVLAIRLLANMVAGHLVLLSIMALAFSIEGAMNPNWTVTAIAAVVGATALSCLELFVAFLQAYVFTLLSALFIGAATHKH